MKTIRMKGVVRLANSLRRELSQTVTPLRRDELRSIATNAIQQIHEIVSANASSVQALAAPSLRAYEFIRSINFDAVALAPAGTTDEPINGSIRFDGLKGSWERRLDILGRSAAGQVDALYQWVVSTSGKIEKAIEFEGINPQHLTTATRDARAWTGFFSDRENFDAYVQAVARASDCIASRMPTSGRMQPPVTVQFRPTRSLYRARGTRDGTRVVLPTPMFTFSAELFAALANAIFNGGSKQEIMQAVAGDEYQTIQAELEALAGVVETTRGVHRDLAESFERVNHAYFDGAMTRPRLTWSRVFTGRKFGHYDLIHGIVMVSSTLDSAEVPEFVVDFIMYHELLHRKFGADWKSGRMAIHTPEFRRAEERFARFVEAESHLQRIASGEPTA